MRILFTGASSLLGTRVLERLLEEPICTHVFATIHQNNIALSHPKLTFLPLDLEKNFDTLSFENPIDMTVHFAALAHAFDVKRYWQINYHATLKLVEKVRNVGCRKFFYVSSRCAIEGAGGYGESKLATEKALQKMDWESLILFRPSEVYGLERHLGIDQFIRFAERYHFVPMIFGDSCLRFSPLHLEDFVRGVLGLLSSPPPGFHIRNFNGPECLTGITLALRLVKKFKALPLPVWAPFLELMIRFLEAAGWKFFAPDQLLRMRRKEPLPPVEDNRMIYFFKEAP